MIENMICMKQLFLLDVILNMLFVPTLILQLTTLDTSSKLHSLNKGIEFIHLPSIFRDNNVISAIPSYFENTESPIIWYKYNKPIRNTILNSNKLVSDLDIETSSPDSSIDITAQSEYKRKTRQTSYVILVTETSYRP